MADSAFLLNILKWYLNLSSIVLQITKDVEYFTWEIWTKTWLLSLYWLRSRFDGVIVDVYNVDMIVYIPINHIVCYKISLPS
jgi:hypothetical protein